MAVSYDTSLLIAARSAILAYLESKTAPLQFVIKTSGGITLAVLPLQTPCGSVNVAGKLTFNIGARDDAADATGDAYQAFLMDSAGSPTTLMTIPCLAGSAASANYFVLSSLHIVAGAPVQLISASIG